jgi:hypothetical protein
MRRRRKTLMLGSILKPLLKLAIMFGIVLSATLLFANLAVMPLYFMHPATPQFLRMIGVGTPIICFGAGFLVLVFERKTWLFKYALPVGFLAPSLVLFISFFLFIPQALSAMTLTEAIFILIISLAGVLLMVDCFTGKISGEPWFHQRAYRQDSKLDVFTRTAPIAVSASIGYTELVGAYEVVEIPEEYALNSGPQDQKAWVLFRNVLRAMIAAKSSVGLRLERISGHTRLYFLTLGMNTKQLQEGMNLLGRVLTSVLPKFRFQRLERLNSHLIDGAVAGTLSGEILTAEDPRQRADPLTVIAESLLQLENGVFQTFAISETSKVMRAARRFLTGRSYRSKMQGAQQTISSKKGGLFSAGEASTSVVDIESAMMTDKLYRRYNRHRVESACNAEISVACWGSTREKSEQDVRLLLEVAKSVIIPDDPARELKIQVHRRSDLVLRVMNGKPIGQMTLMTPEEVAMLFTLARCDIGVVLSKREIFSTATKPVPIPANPEIIPVPSGKSERKLVYSEWKMPNHNVIFLGNPIGANGSPMAGSFVWFHPQKFESHVIVCGNVRSGKTTTALSIVGQSMKCGLKVLIIVPMRSSDWLPLMYLFPDSLWIFKVGEDSDISLRINIFQPPPRVQVASWILALGDLLSSWMPNDRVMRIHLDDVLHTTYRNCGWDPKENRIGRPILLSDFWYAVEEVCMDIPYGDEIKQNFYGAIYSRVSNLLRNKILVDMYNTEEGITWEQIANNNILVDVQGVPSDEDRSFVMGLLSTGLHMYKMAHPTKKITNLLVLEEASYVLKKPEGPDYYGHDSGHYAVNRIVEILTTGGGNGIGVLILEQVPGRLMDDVIKLAVNMIVHALGEESERLLVGGHIGVDAKRIEHVHQLGKGETLVFLEGEGTARSVKIQPLSTYLDFPLPEKSITDDDIRAFMEPVHERHPNLKATTDLPREVIDRLERAKPSLKMSAGSGELNRHKSSAIEAAEAQDIHEFVDHHIRDLAQNAKYMNNLVIRMESAKEGDFDPLVKMISDISEEFLYDGVTQFWVAERLMIHSNDLYPALLNKHLMNTALVKIQEQIG